jgi:hypothetical protein
MAERKPLVVIDGEIQELPSGDTVPSAGGGAGASPTGDPAPTKAASLLLTTETTVTSSTTTISFDGAKFDEGGWWDAANPTRLTVPAGVNRIILSAGAKSQGVGASTQDYNTRIVKNGTTDVLNTTIDNQYWGPPPVSTEVLEVVEGDYFELLFWSNQNWSLNEAVTFFSAYSVEASYQDIPTHTSFLNVDVSDEPDAAPLLDKGYGHAISNTGVTVTGGKMVFDGVSYASVNPIANLYLEDKDFRLTVKKMNATDITTGAGYQGIVALYTISANDRSFMLRVYEGLLQFFCSDNGTAGTEFLRASISAGVDYDIVIERVGDNLSLVLNGEEVDTYAMPAGYTFYSPIQPLYFGSYDPGNYDFTGSFESVNIEFAGAPEENISFHSPVESQAAYTVTNEDLRTGRTFKKVVHGSAVTVTVPAGLTNKEPVTFMQNSGGQVTFAAGTGVNLYSADNKMKTRVQFSSVTLIPDKHEAETYFLVGDLEA